MPRTLQGIVAVLGRVIFLALAALDAVEGIGDDGEQRETFDYLVRVVDEDHSTIQQA